MGKNPENLKFVLPYFLQSSDRVFIIPHNNPDFDALGGCIGMAFICEKFKKTPIIIIDKSRSYDKSIESVIENISKRFFVISSTEINGIKGNSNSLIVLDTNKEYLINVSSDDFENVLIVDHHDIDQDTIKTSYAFIDARSSSVCEIICDLMEKYKVRCNPPGFSNYLLAGIKLDTSNFYKNITSKTYDAASNIIKMGADPIIVNSLFVEDFNKDRMIQRLVDRTEMLDYNLAVACQDENSDIIYSIEDIAKCADYLLKFDINASFAIGKIGTDYYISGRSKGLVDIGNIMSTFPNGGGNYFSGAARIPADVSIEKVRSELISKLDEINRPKSGNEIAKLILK